MRVYKFLSKQWALESVRRRRLKIGQADSFNDPFELFPYAATTRVSFLAMSLTLKEISADKGFICFSRF
jgi:hypothetical protein